MWPFRTEPDSKLAALSEVEPFAQLSPRELAFVGSTADIVRRPRGTRLIDQGGYGLECFVLLEGEVTVTQSAEEVARLGPGSIIGEIALVERVLRTASVIADSDVTLAVFDVRSLQHTMATVPAFDEAVREVLSARRAVPAG